MAEQEDGKPCLFIEGYFSDRVKAGERPTYGYPKSPLPEVPEGAEMQVGSSFIDSLKNKEPIMSHKQES